MTRVDWEENKIAQFWTKECWDAGNNVGGCLKKKMMETQKMHFGSLEENVDRNYMERMVMFSPAFHCGVDLFGNGFGNGPGLAFTLGLCPKKWGDLSTGSGNLGTIWGPHEKVELQSHSPTMNSNHQNSLYPEPIRHQNISLQTH